MPYTPEERAASFRERPWKEVPNVGDINRLFTELILKKWRENPRYSTIHCLKRVVVQPATDNDFWDLRADLLDAGLADIDIRVALELAFDEAYRRLFSEYEDQKAADNGDLYQESLDEIMSGGC